MYTLPKNAAPLFLVISDDDPLVSPISSARLYEQWHKTGRPAELHIFGSGLHGYGADIQNTLSDSWFELFIKWMRGEGFLPKKR